MGLRCTLLACAWLAVGCQGAAAPGRVGSSIAVLEDGRVAVVNPDQGSVSLLDPTSLELLSTIDVGGHPQALLQLKSGALWVTTHQTGQLVAIDVAAGTAAPAIDVCPGAAGLAESPDASWVAIACEWSGQVQRVEVKGGGISTLADGLVRPRTLAVTGSGAVVVAESTTGKLITLSGVARTATSLVPTEAAYRPALTRMTANLAAAVVPAFGSLFVAHELVNHNGDSSDEQVADDYGRVLNGTPKINAAVTRLELTSNGLTRPSQTPPVYSRFDLPEHAFSGPVAIAAFSDRSLLVAHVSTNDVALLDADVTDPAQRLVATFAVGAGPSGIAIDAFRQLAYVDNALDGSVSLLDLKAGKTVLTLVRSLPSPYSAAARAGRKLFYDATNPHVTPSRVVACATCHPAGGDDGLIWFMQTRQIPLKRRRTPHLANAKSATAPFHWDGQFASMTGLVDSTVTDLMAGDDLLVDASTVQAYVDEIVEAPRAPQGDAQVIARGAEAFGAAGCASCHFGPELTDNLLHPVLSPASLSSDDGFTTANTPALHGLRFRAPFFHDGRAVGLRELLTRPDASTHGRAADLAPAQLDDLVTYLESL